MLIAHLSDFHAVPRGQLFRGRIDTNAMLAEALRRVAALAPRPDVAILTGDLVNDADPAEYDALAALLEGFPIPCFALPGNHDSREGLRRVFAGAPWLPAGDGRLHYLAPLGGGLGLLALDSLVPGAPHGHFGLEDGAIVASLLARHPGPLLVAVHHPPVASGLRHMDTMRLFDEGGVAAALRAHGQVQRVLCGHLHRAMVAGWAGLIVTVAPSTAHQLDLALDDERPAAWTREPPGFWLHRWSPSEGLASHLVPIGAFGGPTPFAG